MFISWMLIMPSFQKSLIVEQFQWNYLKPMIHGSTSCNICCSTNVEQCCTNVLNGIELVSIFVQHRLTTFNNMTRHTVQHFLNISCNICWSTNAEPCIIGLIRHHAFYRASLCLSPHLDGSQAKQKEYVWGSLMANNTVWKTSVSSNIMGLELKVHG